MEEAIKYLAWLGLILAVIGHFVGNAIGYVALAEFVIGIIIGILGVQHELKGVGEKAVMYSIIPIAMAQFPAPAYAAEVLGWMRTYFLLMALMYVPAAFIKYLVKTVKEGI
ncbi:TPA: hypothetical protein EYP13_04305 [Candidatus Micrarchaeota archaeon]|nr:hypothetical protein [Candidatus Micrarchaeota archaeon]